MGELSTYERRSVLVGAALVLAVAATYIAVFPVRNPALDPFSVFVVVGLALVSGYTMIEVPSGQKFYRWNLREAGGILLVGVLDPRYAIPMLLLLRAHQWLVTGGSVRWKLLTITTGLETIVVNVWVLHAYGALANPSALTPAVILQMTPWFAGSALLSFVVFALVHPSQSAWETARGVPLGSFIAGTVMCLFGTLIGAGGLLLMRDGHLNGIMHGILAVSLLCLLATSILRQYQRTRAWVEANKIVNGWSTEGGCVGSLLQQLHTLSPPSSQKLFVEDPVSHKVACAWVGRWRSKPKVHTCDVMPDLPENGSVVGKVTWWNPTGMRGIVSVTRYRGITLIQIAPRVRVSIIPRIPHNTRNDLSSTVEPILEALQVALEQRAISQHGPKLVELSTLLDDASDGFVIASGQNIVQSWSRRMVEWTGISSDDAVGQSLSELLPKAPLKVAETQEPVLVVNQNLYLQPSVSWASIDGESRLLHSFRDVSPVVAATQTRSSFFSQVLHDFKSPLASLYLQADHLESQYEDDPVVHELQESVEQLNAYVNDLRSIAEFAVTKMKPVVRPVRTSSSAVLESRWFHDLPVDVREHFFAEIDVARAQQVVAGLVSNALKFSPADSVSIRINTDGKKGTFYVLDRGIGVREQDREKIFEPYFRGGNASGVPGDGVGLIAAQTLAKHMNGEVTYQPRDGGGSIFAFSVPVVDDGSPHPRDA